jgi:hypothetical protein
VAEMVSESVDVEEIFLLTSVVTDIEALEMATDTVSPEKEIDIGLQVEVSRDH